MSDEILVRRSWLRPLIAGAPFVAAGLFVAWGLLSSGDVKPALAALWIIPGIGAILGAVSVWEAFQPGLLTIRDDGFRIETPRRVVDLPWSRVQSFYECEHSRFAPSHLGWLYNTGPSSPTGLLAGVGDGLTRGDIVPVAWRTSTNQLVSMMNVRLEASRR